MEKTLIQKPTENQKADDSKLNQNNHKEVNDSQVKKESANDDGQANGSGENSDDTDK